jgi:EmrB/QacA subfamily drug resistance transporter
VPATEPSSRRRTAALAVASLGAFVAFLDVTIVNIAFPDIRRSFPDADVASLSWVLNAYNVVFAAFLVPAGRLADLLGRRRLYVAGLAVFTLASLACALAPSPAALIAARVLQALGAAVLVPTSLALLLPAFGPRRRAAAVTLWSATAAVASGVGPSLGGALIELADWRLVFLVNVPLGIVAIPVAARLLEERREAPGSPLPDLAGAALLAGAVGALALGIVQGETWGWDSAGVLGALGAAIVLGAAALRRTAGHPSPVVELGLLRVRSFALANAATLVLAVAFYAAILCNVLFLTAVWDYSVLEAGLAVTPAPLTATIVAGLAERLGRRIDLRAAIAPGALLLAAGVAFFALRTGVSPDFLGSWLPGMVMVGAGVGLAFPALGSVALESVPAERFATATALNATARQLGAVLGIALLVALLGTPGPQEAAAAFDRGWTFCALVAAAGACLLAVPLAAPRPAPAAA